MSKKPYKRSCYLVIKITKNEQGSYTEGTWDSEFYATGKKARKAMEFGHVNSPLCIFDLRWFEIR